MNKENYERPEDETLEYKSFYSERGGKVKLKNEQWAKILKTFVGFANAKGGTFILGMGYKKKKKNMLTIIWMTLFIKYLMKMNMLI